MRALSCIGAAILVTGFAVGVGQGHQSSPPKVVDGENGNGDCSKWAFYGVTPETTEAQFLALFPGNARRDPLSTKKRPRYTLDYDAPEAGLAIDCVSEEDLEQHPGSINSWEVSTSTSFKRSQLVNHDLVYYPPAWLQLEAFEADRLRRGHTGGEKVERVEKQVRSCLASLWDAVEARLGQPGVESPAAGGLFRVKSWMSDTCNTKVVVGLFNRSGGDAARCCGHPALFVTPWGKTGGKPEK